MEFDGQEGMLPSAEQQKAIADAADDALRDLQPRRIGVHEPPIEAEIIPDPPPLRMPIVPARRMPQPEPPVAGGVDDTIIRRAPDDR